LGVEPSPEFCQVLASTGIPYIQGTLANITPETHGRFDIIFMSHVLEHFYDPNEALQHCRGLLADGGVLTVEVPNILKPFRSLDRYFLRYVHPSSFSRATLVAMLEKHGYEPQIVDEGGYDWRLPQNLFVISRKGASMTCNGQFPAGRSKQVIAVLDRYRQHWKWSLAPRWCVRSLILATRRMTVRLGRPIKRRLLGLAAE
jgi:SAM-dependent methyltransferase